MRVTATDLAALKRKAEQPVPAEGEVLAIFVAGRLLNPLNGTPWVWQKRTRYARGWKERVAASIYEGLDEGLQRPSITTKGAFAIVMAEIGPKRVTFLASTHNRMDSDGLQAALKPIRDALVECGVIAGDADKDGNVFEYAQKIDRKRRGVEIRVRPL